MTYSTVMVHVQPGQSNASLLQAADRLAGQFQARVVGIAACQPMQVVYTEGCAYNYGDVLEEDRQEIDRQITAAEVEFRRALSRHEAALEWQSDVIYTPIAEYVAHAARVADIVLIGANRTSVANGSRCAYPGELIMQVGRPVIMVPAAATQLAMDRVMIGWNDTREARRAALDALPILLKAKDVGVVAIAAEADMAAARKQLDGVADWLKQHGIVPESFVTASNGDDSARLGCLARDRGAELIVAGAYGHSRLREWALGGVTRELLLHADHCSLLSH